MKETWETTIDSESKLKLSMLELDGKLRFSMVYIFRLDDWADIARIDNY